MTPDSAQASLTDRVVQRLGARLEELRALSFAELVGHEPRTECIFKSRWREAVVWEDVECIDADTVRVAVLGHVGWRFWPGYFHSHDGFRRARDGEEVVLTTQDHYALD